MGMHHTFGQFEGSGPLLVKFKILDTSGTPTIIDISPPISQTADLAITDTGVGVYDVVVTNFKGQQGKFHVQATPVVLGYTASCTTGSYTGDALAITIKVMDGATPTAADSSVYVTVDAW